ncbi:MAG: hypothetical protein GX280_01955 [Lentisphaerae bacterium]|jgi:hypothetical protein|nr:hypothetical protein [Victivallaceae bacterium]MDD5664395.1 hypothetical protein [Victivallaceae bacterium]NLK82831.1 hypothetical protein [Lentisphaerota bacterium]
MKIKNYIMSAVLLCFFGAGLAAKEYWKRNKKEDRSWNIFETRTAAEKAFLPLIGFIKPGDDGKLPNGRQVKNFSRKLPYIMIFYSVSPEGWQAAFWDCQDSWLYDSKSGAIYRMDEDLTGVAWYDQPHQRLIAPPEAAENNIIYTRL